jgi:polar amino acid transport system substrate-binding protein
MRIWPAVLVLVFAAVAPPVRGAAPADGLVLATGFGPPLHQEGQTGILDRFLIRAFARIGRTVRIDGEPAERALINADTGIDDGDASRIRGMSARYRHLVRVPARLLTIRIVAFSRRGHPVAVHGWGSLAPYSVGIVRGYKIAELNVRARDRTDVASIPQLMHLLEMGRVDVAVIDLASGIGAARTAGYTDLRVTGTSLAVLPEYVYLNRTHRDLVAPLAAAIRVLDRSRSSVDARFADYCQRGKPACP